MAKLPSFQFYPGDWMKDFCLRRCSIFARGLLVDLLCLMFEAPIRGVLCEEDGATPLSDEEIVALIQGGDMDEKLEALQELEAKRALSRDGNGCLYCRRMVRDEQIRRERESAGSKGGSKTQANRQAKPQANGEAKTGSSSSSSTSSSDKENSSCPGKPDDGRTAPKFVYSTEEMQVAEHILAGVRRLAPNSKEPNLARWANDVRLMRTDGPDRTLAGIAALFDWANHDAFWCKNILSPDRLRKQWDQLTVKRDAARSIQRDRDNTGADTEKPGRGHL